MSRFFCANLPQTDPSNDDPCFQLSESHAPSQGEKPLYIELDQDESNHGRRVLRLADGAQIELFDGQGNTARGIAESWQPRATVRIEAVVHHRRPTPRLDMAVCLPKGPRADQLVAQLSQLGVDTLIPLKTARSVVDPRDAKLERFRRACIESAKQCARSWLMQIATPADFGAMLNRTADLRLIADPAGTRAAPLSTADTTLAIIGPEGGWTEGERRAARHAGFAAWPLGPNVMRIETAAAAAAAIWAYHCKQTHDV